MDCLIPFKKYASFDGRASRSEYWSFFFIFQFLVIFIFVLVEITIPSMGFLLYLYIASIIVPGFAVMTRRLHDIGKSGMWMFISFVPFVGGIILFFFLIQRGDSGKNQYDPADSTTAIASHNSTTNGADLGLVNFVRSSRNTGKTDEDIRAILSGNNWSDDDITLALSNDPPQTTGTPEIVDEGRSRTLVIGSVTAIVLILVVAGVVLKKAQNKEILVPDSGTTTRPQSVPLESIDFKPKTINDVEAKLSLYVPEENDDSCGNIMEKSQSIGETGREFTICVKTTSRCDKVSDLDFDVSEQKDRVLLKYSHEPIEQCAYPGLKYVHLVYTFSNLSKDGVSSEVSINQPDQKVAKVEGVVDDGGAQLTRDADLFCAWSISFGAMESRDKEEQKKYMAKFDEIVKKYNIDGFESFVPEWKKIELRLKSNEEYYKKVYLQFEKTCLKDADGNYIKF